MVYLTEQGGTSFREAISRASLDHEEDFTVLLWRDAISVSFPEVISQAVAECKARNATVLAVDTLSQWAGIRGDGENDAGEALEAIEPLQEAAGKHGVAVVVVRHSRKSGGDVGDDARGSSAFTGAADIVISVRRPEHDAMPKLRTLHALSRFEETPEDLVLELTPTGYVSLGSEAAIGVQVAKRKILAIAPTNPEDAMTLDDLIGAAGVHRTTSQQAVHALVQSHDLIQIGQGRKGSPFKYYRLPDHFETQSLSHESQTDEIPL